MNTAFWWSHLCAVVSVFFLIYTSFDIPKQKDNLLKWLSYFKDLAIQIVINSSVDIPK
jgi:hypothetical protein